jgi:hypothetical protein
MKRADYMTHEQKAQTAGKKRTHDAMRRATAKADKNGKVTVLGVARPGKTAQDKARGAAARAASNRATRADWQNSDQGKNPGLFPWKTCNGKRNRQA